MSKKLAMTILFAIVLPIHGQEKSTQATSDQKNAPAGKYSASPGDNEAQCTIKKEGSAIECRWPKDAPQSKFQRLFSFENALNIGLFLVGVCGVIAAICTLMKIERQTAATEKQVGHMMASERAWLFIGRVKESFKDPIMGGGGILTWEIRNVGKTPALLIETQARFLVDHRLFWPVPEEPSYGEPIALGGRMLAPGDKLTFHGFPVKDGVIAFHNEIPDPEAMIHVSAFGYVKYLTFGEIRESRFFENCSGFPIDTTRKFTPYLNKDLPLAYTKHT